jgi:hypothetical protein
MSLIFSFLYVSTNVTYFKWSFRQQLTEILFRAHELLLGRVLEIIKSCTEYLCRDYKLLHRVHEILCRAHRYFVVRTVTMSCARDN